MLKRIIAAIISVTFIASSLKPVLAQEFNISKLPVPGTMVNLSPAYVPVLIKGLVVHPENPLLFDFILDTGKSGLNVKSLAFKTESKKLIKYFLASLTIKEDDLWVNLSPYEKDRIVPNELGKTGLGRDMLAQDYILKQLTASLIYPERKLGKKFWDRVYTKAQQMFGSSDIPVNTFNKVWIVADKAKILERNNVGYVVGAHLKVMLEEDYVALNRHSEGAHSTTEESKGDLRSFANAQDDKSHTIASQIIRHIILPELEKEVNQGQNFASLRQMFYSMILASWYKLALKDALLNQVYSNKGKTGGVLSDDPTVKEKIYQQYLKAYKKGVFNYIKEGITTDPQSKKQGILPRKYFSGGLKLLQKPVEVESELQTGESAAMVADGAVAIESVSMIKKDQDGAMTGNLYQQAYEALQKIVPTTKQAWQVKWGDFLSLTLPDGTPVNVSIVQLLSGRYSDGRFAISNADRDNKSFLGYVTPDGNILRDDGWEPDRPTLELILQAVAKVTPEGALYNRTVLQAQEEAHSIELQKITMSRERNPERYKGRKEKLEILRQRNEKLAGVPKDQFSLQLFLKVVNILEAVFPYSLPTIKPTHYSSLGDLSVRGIRTRSGSNGVNNLFVRNNQPLNSNVADRLLDGQDAVFLQVLKYQELGGNSVEFIKDRCTLHLMDDPKDNTRVRVLLRPRHPFNPLPCWPGYFEAYENLVKAGIPVLWDDPKVEENQFSRVYQGKYNYKWDSKPDERESGPLFQTKSEAMITGKDFASTALPPGGIDLNAKNMSLDVAKDGKGVEMKFDPAMVAEFRRGDFSGIVPVIVRIRLITSVLPILGLETIPTVS